VGGSPRARGTPTAIHPFSRILWFIGVGVVATSVAVASLLPEPLQPLRSTVADTSKTSRSDVPTSSSFPPPSVTLGSFALPGTSALDLNEPNLERTAFLGGRTLTAATTETVGQPIPGQHLTIRTDGNGEFAGSFEEPLATARLLFASTNPTRSASTSASSFETRLAYRAGSIERSLIEDGRVAGLSDPLILKLAEIFGWDIDFALDLREGDRFVVIYEEKFWFGKKIVDGAILAAEFWNRGRAYRAVGVRDEYGRITYFTPAGKSLRRPFLRTPVQFGSVSSSFSKSRYHPILKTWRAHNGVDYSAPPGTAVHATASGRIIMVGPNGGYGNTIVIDHGNSFSTLYAHLSRYRPGLRAGQHVEQGEVIGYVGRTGLATGAHLHYEFQVHGKHQNPLTFEFPPGDVVAPAIREQFLRDARAWTAHLDLLSGRQLAAR
jgi:murein DD-endopeptidase MepM/ murein hydrolase activator NlpD